MNINKITDLLDEIKVESEKLSNNDMYVRTALSLEEVEALFASIGEYDIKFVRSEPIIYN